MFYWRHKYFFIRFIYLQEMKLNAGYFKNETEFNFENNLLPHLTNSFSFNSVFRTYKEDPFCVCENKIVL